METSRGLESECSETMFTSRESELQGEGREHGGTFCTTIYTRHCTLSSHQQTCRRRSSCLLSSQQKRRPEVHMALNYQPHSHCPLGEGEEEGMHYISLTQPPEQTERGGTWVEGRQLYLVLPGLRQAREIALCRANHNAQLTPGGTEHTSLQSTVAATGTDCARSMVNFRLVLAVLPLMYSVVLPSSS